MKLTCEICGNEFQAQHARPHGDHCKKCAEWLRALKKGPLQEDPETDYEKLGNVMLTLLRMVN